MLLNGLRRIRGSTLSQKIILLFIIILVPLYALGQFFIQSAMKELELRKYDAMSSQSTFFLASLKSEIDRINALQRQYVNDRDLQKIAYQFPIMNDYEKIRSYTALYTRLQTLEDSSRYAKEVSVYFPGTHRVLYAGTITDLQSASDIERMEQKYAADCDSSSAMLGSLSRLNLCMTFPTVLAPGEAPTFYFNIELSTDELVKALNEINDLGGAILFNPHWSLASSGQESLYLHAIEQTRSEASGVVTREISYNDVSYIASSQYESALDLTLMLLTPESLIFGSLRHYQIWVWLLSAVSVVIIVTFSYLIYRLIHKPLRQLLKQFRRVEEGHLEADYAYNKQDEFSYLNRGFQAMVGNLKQLIDETFVQKIQLQKSELKQLQTQINPHFLYNSFYILRNAIRGGDYETADKMSLHLGDYFQYVTRNDQDEVPLRFEYEHALSYVAIQDIRFSHRITTSFDPIPEEVAALKVPRLILQPLIENAYKHGFNETLEGGRLDIEWRISKLEVIVTVEDNGKGMNEDALMRLRRNLTHEAEGADISGLTNVHRRLQLRYGERARIAFGSDEGRGFTASLHIPLHESGTEELKSNV